MGIRFKEEKESVRWEDWLLFLKSAGVSIICVDPDGVSRMYNLARAGAMLRSNMFIICSPFLMPVGTCSFASNLGGFFV